MKFFEKKEIGAGTLLAPLPVVIVSVGTPEDTNLITIAWTGIVNTKEPMLSLSVRKERKSHAMLLENPRFIVNLLTKKQFPLADLVGTKSGKFYDKIKEHQVAVQSLKEGYPLALKESPFALCCTVVQQIPLGSHDLFLAKIDTSFSALELINEKGALSFAFADLLSYAHGKYYAGGKEIGFFGEMRAPKQVVEKKKVLYGMKKEVSSLKEKKTEKIISNPKSKEKTKKFQKKDRKKA